MINKFVIDIPVNKKDYKQEQSDLVMCEIGKILQAAVINSSFREELLSNPVKSMENGYFGEKFQFPDELMKNISRIRSHTLDQFTIEVLNLFNMLKTPELVEIVY